MPRSLGDVKFSRGYFQHKRNKSIKFTEGGGNISELFSLGGERERKIYIYIERERER